MAHFLSMIYKKKRTNWKRELNFSSFITVQTNDEGMALAFIAFDLIGSSYVSSKLPHIVSLNAFFVIQHAYAR